MPMNPRLLRPTQNMHPEAADWANRVRTNGGTVSGSTLMAVSRFCRAIDAAVIRDRFVRLNLFCGNSDANLNAVRTPLYRGFSLSGTQFGGATDTNNAFQEADYAETGATGGLNGNGSTKRLLTGMDVFNAGLVEEDTHLSVYVPTAGSTSNGGWGAMGALNGAGTVALILHHAFAGGNLFFFSGTNNTGLNHTYSGAKVGHVLATRTGASTGAGYHRSVAMGGTPSFNNTGVFSSSNPGELAIFARQAGGSFAYDGRLAAYSVGRSFTATQAAAYNTAMEAFQAALGRNAA
jgi:hypothetical protein